MFLLDTELQDFWLGADNKILDAPEIASDDKLYAGYTVFFALEKKIENKITKIDVINIVAEKLNLFFFITAQK
jgi:hypothetical protein